MYARFGHNEPRFIFRAKKGRLQKGPMIDPLFYDALCSDAEMRVSGRVRHITDLRCTYTYDANFYCTCNRYSTIICIRFRPDVPTAGYHNRVVRTFNGNDDVGDYIVDDVG